MIRPKFKVKAKGPYTRRPRVFCSKTQEFVDERAVKFVNIEENFTGEDILTFDCICGERHKSKRWL